MSSKTPTFVSAFNEQLIQFMNDVLIIYPNDVIITSMKNYFITGKKLNPVLFINAWYIYILPYQINIEQGDIGFFINKDYSQDLQNMEGLNKINGYIDQIREKITLMTLENQTKSMSYVQLLTRLSIAYNSTK